MMIDAATRESLELTQSSAGDPRREPARCDRPDRHRRRRAAARRRSRRAACSIGRGSRRGSTWSACSSAIPGFASALRRQLRALARYRPRARPAGRGPRRPARSRPAARRAPRGAAPARRPGAAWPSRRPCSPSSCPRSTGHGALVDLLSRALVPSPPIDAAQGGYIAEGYDAALDALRATGGEGRRAIAALEARYRGPDRHRDAQDPPQQRARLSYRGAGQERRPADGGRIRASPTARRSPAWSASTRPICTSRRCGSARRARMRSPPRRRISKS